jgi:hypothetical protein
MQFNHNLFISMQHKRIYIIFHDNRQCKNLQTLKSQNQQIKIKSQKNEAVKIIINILITLST